MQKIGKNVMHNAYAFTEVIRYNIVLSANDNIFRRNLYDKQN